MKPYLVDAHTHVQFAAYKDDAEEVIKRALDQDIWLVNVGTQKETSAKAIEIAEQYPEGVYATVGIHPIHTEKSFHDAQELGEPSFAPTSAEASAGKKTAEGFASRSEKFDYDYYKKLAQHEKVVAIGECGFDFAAFARSKSERLQKGAPAEALREGGLAFEKMRGKQKKAFEAQINLATELKKPLMIHCRNAYPDLINVLKANGQKLRVDSSGIIHFFSGTKEDARKLLDLGFYFSFGGVITFARDYDEVIKLIGLERIVLETDAPYVTPVPYRSKRNEPSYVKFVAEKLAEILDKPVDKVAERITQNAFNILNLKR